MTEYCAKKLNFDRRQKGKILVAGLADTNEAVDIIGLPPEKRKVFPDRELVVEIHGDPNETTACVLVGYPHIGAANCLETVYLKEGEVKCIEINPWHKIEELFLKNI
jgi:hypothetical protein